MERTTAEAVGLKVLNITKIPLCRLLKKKKVVGGGGQGEVDQILSEWRGP